MKTVVILDCDPTLPEVTKQFGSAPDWIIEILQNKGCRFKCFKSYKGENVTYKEGDAWIITGSSHSVYDEIDWILDLEEQIRNAQKYNKPILGICFGHQIIARSFGGEIKLNPKGWELGAYPIELTESGLRSGIFSNFNNHSVVYESHGDCVITLPKNAIELAFNNKGNQAFKIHNMYGVQFHPEFSWDIIKKYVDVRSTMGMIVDDHSVPESDQGKLVLNNFIDLIQ